MTRSSLSSRPCFSLLLAHFITQNFLRFAIMNLTSVFLPSFYLLIITNCAAAEPHISAHPDKYLNSNSEVDIFQRMLTEIKYKIQ